MPKSLSKLMLAATAAAGALCALDAHAASHRVSERVFYPDLDLGTPAGAQAMLKRISDAADGICAPSRSPVIVRKASAEATARCRSEAIEHAVARLQAPLVTAEYDKIRAASRRMAAAN